MYCPRCGTQNHDKASYCVKCQLIFQQMALRPQPYSMEDDPALRMILPVGRSGLAIAAGYAGLFATTCILAPVALILGILALNDIKQNPKKMGKGRAIFGIVMGSIGSIGLFIILMGTIDKLCHR